MSLYRTTIGRRHFRPSPEEARMYFRTRPGNAARVQRSRQEEHELHRAQIRADIQRAKDAVPQPENLQP